MKYSQYSSNKKGNSAFYIIIAFCLVIIGVAAWFAFSRMNAEPQTQSVPESSRENDSKEYSSDNSSYNNSSDMMPETPSEMMPSDIVNETVESEPYTPPKSYALPVNGEILKDFSADTLQYSATFGDMRIHNAVDIACADGTVVTACTDGKVQSIEDSASLGKVVTIDHGDGLIIKYAALKDIAVKNGQNIKMGDRLGVVTTVPSECEDQSHLHIEAFENGKSISVLDLLK